MKPEGLGIFISEKGYIYEGLFVERNMQTKFAFPCLCVNSQGFLFAYFLINNDEKQIQYIIGFKDQIFQKCFKIRSTDGEDVTEEINDKEILCLEFNYEKYITIEPTERYDSFNY